MSSFDYLGKLLHLSDPTLPIGGYTHSNGLETYVQLRIVKDAASAEQYVHNMVANNIAYNDASFVKLAYEAAAQSDVAQLIAMDQECGALKAPSEIRQASRKLGVRLLKIFNRQISSPVLEAYESAVAAKEAEGHYAVVFGMYADLFQIPLYEAVYAYCYNATVGMVTNSVKLIPLSQMDGQDILYKMQSVLHTTTLQVLALDRDLVGICNIGFDIRCMQHERLYSRLYMS